ARADCVLYAGAADAHERGNLLRAVDRRGLDLFGRRRGLHLHRRAPGTSHRVGLRAGRGRPKAKLSARRGGGKRAGQDSGSAPSLMFLRNTSGRAAKTWISSRTTASGNSTTTSTTTTGVVSHAVSHPCSRLTSRSLTAGIVFRSCRG